MGKLSLLLYVKSSKDTGCYSCICETCIQPWNTLEQSLGVIVTRVYFDRGVCRCILSAGGWPSPDTYRLQRVMVLLLATHFGWFSSALPEIPRNSTLYRVLCAIVNTIFSAYLSTPIVILHLMNDIQCSHKAFLLTTMGP